MNVLSLFDGMSCGQLALQKAGIVVDNYFASEIDKYAIQVTQKNFPFTNQLGSVVDIKGSTLPKIDLLIGGSPCQGFSFAGKQLNFEDPRSKLFFEYVRLLTELQPRFFLLENVPMKKEFQDIITSYLKVEPIVINSSLVSAQKRKRLYWTNIPLDGLPVDKEISLSSILQEDVMEPVVHNIYGGFKETTPRLFFGKSPTIRTSAGGGHIPSATLKADNTKYRQLTPVECERLQTVPDNYTSGVSNSQRYKMIGNGWTVDLISWIFSHMPTMEI